MKATGLRDDGKHSEACGFTRTDLMAIIGVLTVLGLMLGSGLAATGRKAGILECKNNLRQVGVAIDQYTQDHTNTLPGPIWSGVFYTYRNNPLDGSMALYLATYFGLPAPDSTFRDAPPLQCPASMDAQPKTTSIRVPPLRIPVCYGSATQTTNAPGNVLSYPFGRPNSPLVAPSKIGQIRRPSEQWALLDTDQKYLSSSGITATTYGEFIPINPVHTARPGGIRETFYRNTLYFDGSVRSQLTSQ